MICVQVDAGGALVAVDPQPAEVSACALVVTSGADVLNSPFAFTPEQGSQIGGAILGVWALGYVFRILVRALSIGDKPEEV
ncbi:hypothetical protein GPA22_17680 [Aromatoleum toluvorans]|uniref:Uncharacterized protein n=1 Tax=Aromatoleum toluvorans TaxID=92002 RepID=A0ABX1Q2F7_9RHOO|nr:hypothetical protein [Aromatoleum toluvorans]NMG45548.1 hypothetical protein [Aromatoleum toluvorans]